jgi:N-carbamoyl-L-amino-acid hydrolase
MTHLKINPDRLLEDLNTLRSFGACGKGVVRPAFSEIDIQSRQWLVEQMASAGLTPTIDPAGNVFGLPPGDGKALLLGSHSDTQPEGGWLDGAYGVIAALEVARASMEVGGPAIAVVSFQDEEGRFGPLLGSNIWAGGLSLSEADKLKDNTGLTFGETRQKIEGICENTFVAPEKFSGFIEAHIEQGIVLDNADQAIGVVDGIVGIRAETYCFSGEQNHAGTTPMHLRRDAFQGLVSFASALNQELAAVVSPTTVWTIGHVDVHPNATSIVPGEVKFTVQWRDGSDALLDKMRQVMHILADTTANTHQLSVQRSGFFSYPATQIDSSLKARIANSAEHLAPGQWRQLPSGALHDASNVSKHLPVAMLFVPSIKGISHSFAEDTALHHLVLGAQVLAASVADKSTTKK